MKEQMNEPTDEWSTNGQVPIYATGNRGCLGLSPPLGPGPGQGGGQEEENRWAHYYCLG